MPIMLIDDTADIRDALAILLEKEGYVVQPFSGARAALTALRSDAPTPSLIVLDLSMPDMDGYAFRREQLADPRLAQIPVIVFSGMGHQQMDLAELGVVAFLVKPIDPSLLLTTIRAHHVPRRA